MPSPTPGMPGHGTPSPWSSEQSRRIYARRATDFRSDDPPHQPAQHPASAETGHARPGVRMVVHGGDIHPGQGHSSLAFDQAVAADWTAFADPLVNTPGDNEWSDCHKSGEGKQDPMTNLGYVRD